jgi:hypothetical protein
VKGEGRRMGVWVLYTWQVAHMQQKFTATTSGSCNIDGHTWPPPSPHILTRLRFIHNWVITGISVDDGAMVGGSSYILVCLKLLNKGYLTFVWWVPMGVNSLGKHNCRIGMLVAYDTTQDKVCIWWKKVFKCLRFLWSPLTQHDLKKPKNQSGSQEILATEY